MSLRIRVSRLALALALLALAAVHGAAGAARGSNAVHGAMSAPAAAPTPATSSGARTLYLIRHGLYDEADPRDEAVGRGLVEAGRSFRRTGWFVSAEQNTLRQPERR